MKTPLRKKKNGEEKIVLNLQGELITIGPGTVPTSRESVSRTSISKMIKYSNSASSLGVSDKVSTQFNNGK